MSHAKKCAECRVAGAGNGSGSRAVAPAAIGRRPLPHERRSVEPCCWPAVRRRAGSPTRPPPPRRRSSPGIRRQQTAPDRAHTAARRSLDAVLWPTAGQRPEPVAAFRSKRPLCSRVCKVKRPRRSRAFSQRSPVRRELGPVGRVVPPVTTKLTQWPAEADPGLARSGGPGLVTPLPSRCTEGLSAAERDCQVSCIGG